LFDPPKMKEIPLRFDRATGQLVPVKSKRKWNGGRFIKGPIPVEWLANANKTLSGCKTALEIWYLSGLNNSYEFRLTPARCRELGLDGKSKWRGLKTLEQEGLIAVNRAPGAAPMVKILKVPEEHLRSINQESQGCG
jgi:hypothetical protein